MKVSREKAALGVFALLVLGGLAVLLSYIFVWGHSLNVAASNIDETVGSLDGYTVLVYNGTAEKRTETVVTPETRDGKLVPRLNSRSTQDSAEDSTEETTAADVAESAAGEEGEESQHVSTFTVQRSYVEKQASAIVVDVENPQEYNERTVVRGGSQMFGFLYIDEITAHENYLARRVAQYEELGVDIIVAVVSDTRLLDEYPGVDIVISAREEGLPAHGALVSGTFYEDVPLRGQVGTVLISPSRTITAKDVAEL